MLKCSFSYIRKVFTGFIFLLMAGMVCSGAIVEVFSLLSILLWGIAVLFFEEANLRFRNILHKPYFVLMSAIVGFSFFSFIPAGDMKLYVLKKWASIWLEGGLLLLSLLTMFDEDDWRNLLKLAVVLISIVSFDVFLQYVLGYDIIRHRSFVGENPTGPFKHYNNLGGFLVSFIPLVIFGRAAKDIEFKKDWDLWFVMSFFYVFVISILVLTFSRGSWLAFLGSVVFYFLACRGRHCEKRYLVLMALVFLGIIIGYGPAKDRAELTFKKGGDSGRVILWKNAINAFKSSPIVGVGTGMYNKRYFPKQLLRNYVHNCFLQVLAENGIFVFLFFMLLVFYTIFLAWYNLIRGYYHRELLAFSMAFAAYCIGSFFDVHFYTSSLGMLFWILVSGVIFWNSFAKEATREVL